jgi:hypothetical protein
MLNVVVVVAGDGFVTAGGGGGGCVAANDVFTGFIGDCKFAFVLST